MIALVTPKVRVNSYWRLVMNRLSTMVAMAVMLGMATIGLGADIVGEVQAEMLFGTNLIVNGDAESDQGGDDVTYDTDITGWLDPGPLAPIKYGTPGSFIDFPDCLSMGGKETLAFRRYLKVHR